MVSLLKPDAGKLLYLALGFVVVPIIMKRVKPGAA